ncbi:MAG TPA: hypothetical protein VHY48_11495 [Acidobacteriaceae bacterium]|jgi:hypothetical protein|nr:hypothetical protein [Acidobacteriaceae bacterium]
MDVALDAAAGATRWMPRPLRQKLRPLAPIFFRRNLNALATLYETDKWGSHWYTQHYQRYFASLRKVPLNLLEIGVGGEDSQKRGGESLRMWKAFFPKAQIVGIDIYDKTHFREPRIDIRICDQTDATKLRKLSEEYGGFNIVIDDGSHINEHVIQTFQILFPLLRDNGIYAIEDTQTSYWPSFGGGIDSPSTLMTLFKSLVDGLNHVEFPIEDYSPDYFERNIVEVAFFHNLVVIRKGSNSEKTNAPRHLQAEIVNARGAAAE